MKNLQRFENNGLQLIIDTNTGDVYATQGMIAKLTKQESSTIRYFYNKRGIQESLEGLAVKDSRGVEQISKLYNEEAICEAIANYNPSLLTQCWKAGLRVFLHGLAGYKYEAKLQAPALPPTPTKPPTLLELAHENVRLANINLALAEETELLRESLTGYRNLFSGEATLSMKQAADALKISTLGQNNLIKYLRSKGMIVKKGSAPTKVALDRNYLSAETSEWQNDGNSYTSQKGVLTWKGFCWLVTQLRTDGITIRQSPQSMWDIYYPPNQNTLAQ